MRLYITSAVLSCVVALVTQPCFASITSVTASSGFPYEIVTRGLANNASAYTDRTLEWNDVWAVIRDADYVKTRDDDGANSSLQVNVTLSAPDAFYIWFDNRYPVPAWVAANGFVDTHFDMSLDSTVGLGKSVVTTYSIYRSFAQGGTITLFESGAGVPDFSMYGFASIPEPTVVSLVVVGLTLVAGRYRRRPFYRA